MAPDALTMHETRMELTSHRFCVAPMMDWTDRYCRAFHRLLSARARLYTEMAVADAVLHGDRERLIGFGSREQPVAIQLGGSEPAKLAEAARIAEAFGYCEVNLNVGCPSERVKSGSFGACLMREADLVARCVAAMMSAVSVPVTVKCRIGVDDDDPGVRLPAFIDTVASEGVSTFIVHARKAWLQGLSPKENRTIPPLDYDLVAAVRAERPDLAIILNGGIATVGEARAHLERFDGVMLGRAAYENPAILLDVDNALFGEGEQRGLADVLPDIRALIREELGRGVRLHAMTRHMLGLFSGRPGARQFRRILSERAPSAAGPGAIAVWDEAVAAVAAADPDRRIAG
jgi:tRNA-dihydrouridine synthase A